MTKGWRSWARSSTTNRKCGRLRRHVCGVETKIVLAFFKQGAPNGSNNTYRVLYTFEVLSGSCVIRRSLRGEEAVRISYFHLCKEEEQRRFMEVKLSNSSTLWRFVLVWRESGRKEEGKRFL